MSVIVEDGTVVANSNSYASEADLTAYAAARSVTVTGNATVLLIEAMDFLENMYFIGLKRSRTQTCQWPRAYVWIDDYPVSPFEIPLLLKQAQLEIALAIDAGNGPLIDIPRVKDSVRVGQIGVTYAKNQALTINRKIMAKLQKLLISGGSGYAIVRA